MFHVFLVAACLQSLAFAQSTGKDPVIIIPGITGSTIIDPKTEKTVWFSVRRSKTDDLRLPMTSPILTRDRDSLRAVDIIRKVELPVLPDIEVYQGIIDALEGRGYHEAKWDHPQAADVYYVFPYDWRRDNVENAQALMVKILSAKRVLRRPDLKFDIIAHSMGGLIARYAAMYGSADLPPEGRAPKPTWSGASNINKLMMFGTPNEGSFEALQALLYGDPIIANRKLPLIDDLRPEDVITIPSLYQLLPHRGSAVFFDANLKPTTVDIYNPATWAKYEWGAINDPKFLGKLKDAARLARRDSSIKPEPLKKDANADDRLLSRTTYAQVRSYFAAVLSRAKRFHLALDAPVKSIPIQIYAYGGNCEPTTTAAIIMRNDKKDRWDTIFDAKDIKTADGRTVKKDDIKALIYAPGDGRVTQRSLLTMDQTRTEMPATTGTDTFAGGLFTPTSTLFGCSTHTRLFLDKPIQDSFLSALVVAKQQQP